MEHVWRVFEGEKEYLLKHIKLEIPSQSEVESNGADWNIVCEGQMIIDRETSTACFKKTQKVKVEKHDVATVN